MPYQGEPATLKLKATLGTWEHGTTTSQGSTCNNCRQMTAMRIVMEGEETAKLRGIQSSRLKVFIIGGEAQIYDLGITGIGFP